MKFSRLTFGPFTFEPGSRLLRRDGVELALPPRVLSVLEVLLHRAGEVVPRQELIDGVWKDAFVTDTSLAEAVSVLRQTLGDDAQSPSYIQTLHRRGYRFVAPVAGEPPPGVGVTAAGPSSAAGTRPEPSVAMQLLPWSIATICLILAAIAVWHAVGGREQVGPAVTRFAIAPPAGTRFDHRAPAFALSPDGSRLAWSGCDAAGCRLYVRVSDRLDAVAVPGTDGASAPFFAPDGRSLGFFADGRVKRVSLAGGGPTALAEASDPLGAVWTRDGRIIYAGAGPGLMVVGEGGGEPAALTAPRVVNGEVRHVWPSLHPTEPVLFFTINSAPAFDAAGQLAVLRLDSRRNLWTTLAAGIGRAAAVAEDVLVFSKGRELLAAGFDARRPALTGAPQTVLQDLALAGGIGQFAVASGGALLTASTAAAADPGSLFWYTPNAAEQPSTPAGTDVPPGRALESLALAPDARRAAGTDNTDASRPDIWITDLERGTNARLTHGGVNVTPIWSADGAAVFFASSTGGVFEIKARDADAQGPVRLIHAGAEHSVPWSVTTDGSLLAFGSRGRGSGADVWTVPLDGGPAQPLIRSGFDEIHAVFSPDGRFVAYQSNDGGRWEISLHRREDGRRIAVSTAGGTHPFWSADGRRLFFRSGDRLMRAAVPSDGAQPGTAEVVATIPDAVPIATDARGRILFQRRAAMPAGEAVLALHWTSELRRILGPASADMPR
jgi:DNA-binding winged helix-turn-helix (wHTH) protein/Tol biopolymer transport system component